MHYIDANKMYGEKALRQLHRNAASNIVQILEATTHQTAAVRLTTTHHENYSDIRDTTGEVKTNSLVLYSSGPLHMDEQRTPIYNNSLC